MKMAKARSSAAPARTSTCPADATDRRRARRRRASSTTTRPSTPCSCSTRRPPRSTSTPCSWRSTRTRTSTASTPPTSGAGAGHPGPGVVHAGGHRGAARPLRDPASPARNVCILGRGITIGRPLALLLSQKRPTANAAVTVVHTGVAATGPSYTRRADIVVAAAGVPGIVHPEHLTPGAPSSAPASATRAASCCPTSTRRATEVAGAHHAPGRRRRADDDRHAVRATGDGRRAPRRESAAGMTDLPPPAVPRRPAATGPRLVAGRRRELVPAGPSAGLHWYPPLRRSAGVRPAVRTAYGYGYRRHRHRRTQRRSPSPSLVLGMPPGLVLDRLGDPGDHLRPRRPGPDPARRARRAGAWRSPGSMLGYLGLAAFIVSSS